MRIGLCLPGGGAKGSYQAGVIKALNDKGINNFASISGTSIGSINGYFVFTDNVENLEDMWINIEENSENKVKIINNTVDNSEIINALEKLDNKYNKDTKFFVNYVHISNKNIEEIVTDVSNLDKKECLNAIKYSSLLPFNPKGMLPLKEQFIKDLNEGLYENEKLDGGLVRNTLVEPLIDEDMDKIIIISTRHDYKLPENIKSKIDEDKIIIVRPNSVLTSKDTLRFNKEFCESMYKEGYEIGKLLNL
ncbi:patatin-like phospholipase family protein [Romboutsia sp. 1001713B170207_170306_H8]|nr:patatin-like phospholipase family protein [Romboutsia sp. 1001713B170207_170306_H8]SCH97609.1 Patatin-like phospholipase [uncultured Clostridium sp.]